MTLKILIAVDDTSESRQAVEAAYRFFGADVDYTVLAVQDPQPIIVASQGSGAFTGAPGLHAYLDKALQKTAEQAIEHAQESLPADSETTTISGRAGAAICETAVTLESDIIVIGSHDKSFWERLVDPSVGRYLVDNAPCPVLIVR